MNQLKLLRVCTLLCLIFTVTAHAQLPPFTFTAIPTPQTCLGNGSLSFSVGGTNPAATMAYEVYLLPDTTDPVTTVNTTTVNDLVAGDYLIIATQSLGGQSSTQTAIATIDNNIVPIDFFIDPQNVRCGNDGVITVNVTAGTAATYEIVAGPVTAPPQASNVFSNLPVGSYLVRVNDICGEGDTLTHQLIQLNTAITILGAEPAEGALPSCNQIVVSNDFYCPSSLDIFFPVTLTYSVYPPGGGAPTVVSQVINNGSDYNTAVQAIPFYNGQQYNYVLQITDACGNVYTRNNSVNVSFTVVADKDVLDCAVNVFTLALNAYVAPVTVNFTDAPDDFNPSEFNSSHPNFSSGTIQYQDSGENIPEGDYSVTVTDACGRVATVNFNVSPPQAEPEFEALVAGCSGTGTIIIEIPDREIVTITMTAAPDGYAGPGPDVSAFITGEGIFSMGNLPIGAYSFTMTDSCGDEHDIDVPLFPPGQVLTVQQRPGCEEGFGSVAITGASSIAAVEITQAPDGFSFPVDVSDNISANGFHMNSLPEGLYTFSVADQCGGITEQNVIVTGYHATVSNIDIIPYCGSFDLYLQMVNNSNLASYWLQMYDESTGSWVHPATGFAYTEGAQPNNNSALQVINNFTNINLAFTGQFRVLKMSFIYSNGSASAQRCVNTVIEFTFDGGPVITDAYTFPCSNGLTEVAVIAEGVPPLSYSITQKNGQPFVVSNGTSNLFSGLEPASYNFQVTDDCGNVRNRLFSINELAPIEIASTGFCEGEDSSLYVPLFGFLTYQWYKAGAPETILSTTAVLDFPAYDSVTDAGTYYVSIASGNPDSCLNQVLEYTIQSNNLPNAGNDTTTVVCNNGDDIDLSAYIATGADAGGTFQDTDGTMALNGSMFSALGIAEGTYSFTYSVTGDCGLSDDAVITLTLKDVPQTPVPDMVSPVCEGDNVQLSVAAVAGAAYSWTGPGGFTSSQQNPLITAAQTGMSGTYNVTVTVNGCTSVAAPVNVLVEAVPDAGNDNTVSICNNGGTLNLEDYLSTGHDTGGTWEDTDNTTALSAGVLTITNITAGTYSFKYSVTGCGITDDAIVTITLNDVPPTPATDAVAPVCEGDDVQLSVTGVAGAAYSWTGPGGFTSSQQNPVITNAQAAMSGNYFVTATINNCTSDAAMVPVTINSVPQFTLQGNTLLCDGQSTVLTVVPGNFTDNGQVTYTWSRDGVVINNITSAAIEVSETGSYTVEVENNGCLASRQLPVTENTNPFTIVPAKGCVEEEYMLWVDNADEVSGVLFEWTGPNGYSYLGEQANVSGLEPGEYFVTVTNADGCTQSASITVEGTYCKIPRGITPNGDNMNDNFDLSNLDVTEIKIFNRYGLEVFHQKNYKNEWHGQSYRGDLPAATYFYLVTLGSGRQVSGWVYLLKEL